MQAVLTAKFIDEMPRTGCPVGVLIFDDERDRFLVAALKSPVPESGSPRHSRGVSEVCRTTSAGLPVLALWLDRDIVVPVGLDAHIRKRAVPAAGATAATR